MEFNWSIKLFAGLPERLGVPSIALHSDVGQMSVAELKAAISAEYPEHQALIQISFIARNHAYAAENAIVHASDELALLPPVSGGEGRSPVSYTHLTLPTICSV